MVVNAGVINYGVINSRVINSSDHSELITNHCKRTVKVFLGVVVVTTVNNFACTPKILNIHLILWAAFLWADIVLRELTLFSSAPNLMKHRNMGTAGTASPAWKGFPFQLVIGCVAFMAPAWLARSRRATAPAPVTVVYTCACMCTVCAHPLHSANVKPWDPQEIRCLRKSLRHLRVQRSMYVGGFKACTVLSCQIQRISGLAWALLAFWGAQRTLAPHWWNAAWRAHSSNYKQLSQSACSTMQPHLYAQLMYACAGMRVRTRTLPAHLCTQSHVRAHISIAHSLLNMNNYNSTPMLFNPRWPGTVKDCS